MLKLYRAFALMALLCSSSVWAAAPISSAPPAFDFIPPAQLSGLPMSPPKTHAALLVTNDKGRKVAVAIDLAKPDQQRVLAAYADVDMLQVSWINDRRLVYQALPARRDDRRR